MGPTQSPIQQVQPTWGSFPRGIKRPGREADHLPPLSAEVKNAWSYNFTSEYVCTVWYLVKQREKFALTLLHKTIYGPKSPKGLKRKARYMFSADGSSRKVPSGLTIQRIHEICDGVPNHSAR
jgi:hypothetical protein